jgi:hypothetical protein
MRTTTRGAWAPTKIPLLFGRPHSIPHHGIMLQCGSANTSAESGHVYQKIEIEPPLPAMEALAVGERCVSSRR